MKTISAMDMRKHMGEYLDEVRLKSETLILERAGKAIAMLVPITKSDRKGNDKTVEKKMNALRQLSSISAGNPRSNDIKSWLREERDGWGERT